jgi:glycosyltransferase involved in cell wall biosynthesis
MRFVLAHPDINTVFVREAGLALREAGWPCRAVTSYVDRPQAWWRRLLAKAGRVAGVDVDREFRRRELKSAPWESVGTSPFWELLRIAALRSGLDARLGDMLFNRALASLERRAIGTFGEQPTHVYGYEYCARQLFAAASARDIRRIYEVPSPEYAFVERLLGDELRAFPELRTAATPYFERLTADRLERRREEWRLADLVIVNSTFTLKTFKDAGYATDKVAVVPYGAPPAAEAVSPNVSRAQPFRFLWVGTFSIRKGAHHLLEAWHALPESGAELHIYGAWDLPARLRADLPPSIRFHGPVPQAELSRHYGDADMLVFPTLCDGFGMVVTEAFAHGLPVLTTDRAGAADLVKQDENGMIVAGGDVRLLAETMAWCVAHRERVAGMRGAALETARRRPWSAYRAELAAAIAQRFPSVPERPR